MTPLVLCYAIALFRGSPSAERIVAGARLQLAHPANYDPTYVSIGYPNGDVAANRGACTDVVIRALRNAGFDLQRLVHEDMKRHLSAYPRHGSRPDSNIDHRRVPNLIHYFSLHGKALSVKFSKLTWRDWQPGDIVFWKLPNGLDHCGVLSDRRDASGWPLVVHNLARTAEEDVLGAWKVVGHYRFPKS